ncbi:MAG TPA: glycosyltransferase family 4 protein [Anaeromyxobacteraceae bacterium]|jgi:glycosyltransferase involved in cell wall biosynthesis|nr:glycosyltransferase family 4 protein [Anaeromyxobacteraceae bacterium]
MHLLMTADTLGGVFSYALELAAALGRLGVRVTLATEGAPLDGAQWVEARGVPGLQVFESQGRLEWMEDPWPDVARTGAWLRDLSARLRPDVVHLNSYAHGALRFGAPVVVVAHSCVCSWFEAVQGTAAPERFDRYRREVARGLAGADLVVAPTLAMLQAVERHYGQPRRARVILNGRSPARFERGERPKEELVLCAGRLWDAAKNVALLDGIAGDLAWPVLLAGEAEHPDPAHRGSGAARHARRLGRLSSAALSRVYARAAIYALPARYEPFGLSALEAALAGCALVLGDIPSLREVWGAAATFVRPDDPSAWRAALTRLMARPGQRSRLAARARARALALSPERMARSYLEAYQDLLGDRERAAARRA